MCNEESSSEKEMEDDDNDLLLLSLIKDQTTHRSEVRPKVELLRFVERSDS